MWTVTTELQTNFSCGSLAVQDGCSWNVTGNTVKLKPCGMIFASSTRQVRQTHTLHLSTSTVCCALKKRFVLQKADCKCIITGGDWWGWLLMDLPLSKTLGAHSLWSCLDEFRMSAVMAPETAAQVRWEWASVRVRGRMLTFFCWTIGLETSEVGTHPLFAFLVQLMPEFQ